MTWAKLGAKVKLKRLTGGHKGHRGYGFTADRDQPDPVKVHRGL